MNYTFNVEKTGDENSGAPRKEVDWDALNKHIVETVDAVEGDSVVGVISGIVDLGIHQQEDAKMIFTGTEEDERAEIAKNPLQYFETLPNDKGVPTRYKRWPVKPVQMLAITVDFPDKVVDKAQFFGDESKPLPYRVILNGEFYMKDVGRVVGKPYAVKETKQDDGSWAFKSNTVLHKLAAATGVLNEQGRFKPHMIGNLLGKAALFNLQVFLREYNGKQYLEEKVSLAGKIPKGMPVPELDKSLLYGVNFKGPQDPKVIEQLRVSIKNTMRQAINFEGSDVQKAIEAVERGRNEQNNQGQQQAAPVQGAAKQEQEVPTVPAKVVESEDDSFDDDVPF